MSLLLSSAALSLLAAVAVWLAGRRDPACSPRLTCGALLALLALPLLALLPKLTIELPAVGGASDAAPVSSVSWLALAWAAGFAFFALGLVADFMALGRWRRRAIDADDPEFGRILDNCRAQLGLRRGVSVRIHPECSSPSIAGLWRPVVYLPAASRLWRRETLRMVLLHELGHVARRDLWTSLAARFACLLHWFNPLVWWLRRRLIAQCEFACDARVISAGADPAHYASALCDVAESGPGSRAPVPHAALAMAGPASLRQRVERVVRCQKSRGSLLAGAALLLTVTASLALSVVRFSAPPLAAEAPAAPAGPYTPDEVHLRLTADPFPAD